MLDCGCLTCLEGQPLAVYGKQLLLKKAYDKMKKRMWSYETLLGSVKSYAQN